MKKEGDGNLLERWDSVARLNIKLYNSPFLELVLNKFKDFKIDWGKIEQRLEWAKNIKNKNHFVGLVGEEILNMYLQKAAQLYPLRIKFGAIPHFSETENYKFLKNGNRTEITNKNCMNKASITDIDSICLFDGIPIIWETKLIPEDVRKPIVYKQSVQMITDAIGPSSLARVIYPVHELFGQTPGFVLIGEVLPNNRTEIFKNFERIGGKIVNFPESRAKIYHRIKELILNKNFS